MPDKTFTLSDPSTYNIRKSGLPDQKFVYVVQVNQTTSFGITKQTHITIRSQYVRNEDELFTTAEGIVLSSSKDRYSGSVDSMEVIDATRPASRGI